MCMWFIDGMKLAGKFEVVGERLVLVLLFPLKLAHEVPGIEPGVFTVTHTAER